jgi:hypothetical protein
MICHLTSLYYFRLSTFHIESTFFYKTTYLNNEAKCAELSLSVRIPWLKLLTINLYDANPRSNVLTANCYFKAEKSVRMEKEWKIPLGEFLLKEKDPSVDLLVLTSSGQVLFILKLHFSLLTKQPILIRRPNVLSFPFQVGFPGLSYSQ